MATIQQLGPGSLTFGEDTPKEFAGVCSKVSIKPDISKDDPVTVLSGEDVADEGVFRGTLEGDMFQEFTADGLTAWTWQHNGEVLGFVFRPRSDAALTVTGTCQITAVEIGGDVKKKNTTSFSFDLQSEPHIGTGAGGA